MSGIEMAFAEIPEPEATGAVAALYADLRAVTGVPLVNLIWRHLATVPGMLPWTWELARPLHASGLLANAMAELLAGMAPPSPGGGLPICVFEAACVSAQDRATIAALIAEYERGNTANLLSLLAVLAILRGEAAGGQMAPQAAPILRTPAAALPPLPALTALAPPVLELVRALDQFGRTAPSNAIASLYRHLAHWPGFLAIAYAALAARHADGSLRAAHEATLGRAREISAARLLPVMTQPPVPDAAGAAAAIAALDQFTTQMIARMVVMGRALNALLPVDASVSWKTFRIAPAMTCGSDRKPLIGATVKARKVGHPGS